MSSSAVNNNDSSITPSPVSPVSVKTRNKAANGKQDKHSDSFESDDDDEHSPNGSDSANKKAKITRRSVACKSCHSLKVKCTPSDAKDPSAPCVRCLSANRKCEIDLNQTRKRRKKAEILEARKKEAERIKEESSPTPVAAPSPLSMPTFRNPTMPSVPSNLNPASFSPPPYIHPQLPSPVFESNKDQEIVQLKQRVRALEQQLSRGRMSGSQQFGSESSMDSPPFISKQDLEQEIGILAESSSKLTYLTQELNSLADKRARLLRNTVLPDSVSKGLLSLGEAEHRLKLYRERIFAFLPLVEIPADLNADQLRMQQPFLFNAVMSASNTVNPTSVPSDQALALDNEAIRSVCDEVMVVGTKSVELIKSILVLSLYYNSPEMFRQRRYHLLNTVCVSLLHDLGIVARPMYSFTDGAVKQDLEQKTNEEYRSLVLIIYFNTVSICLILRRSIYIKWTSYVEECCAMLENSQFEKYRKLALFARINAALEKIHHIIHSSDMDDRRTSTSSYIIAELHHTLTELRKRIKDDDHAFSSYYYSVEAYLHEPNLNHIFNQESTKLSARSVKAISCCTKFCLAALNEYTKLSLDQVAQMPLAFGSRVMYTGGMLLRLRYLVMSLPSHIDKEMVPRDAVVTIQRVVRLVEQAHVQHPDNHLLKKTRLVMQLFTQTYATQIEELLYKNNETPQNLKPVNMEKPLDLLSFAAYQQSNHPPKTPQEEQAFKDLRPPKEEQFFRETRLPSISLESQNMYNTINDEFWSNLISTDADQINFISTNEVNDEIFFN
ncbi:uncharacterized protein LODBEIA_P30610 [Lodderomyces beijingensis]|uniref:Zn(2)-C6 fungal-type domain-containing protein n=1 Tax=Lodderomyces beijingensis TaxID=1775926 RepID=A0ABP0ZRH1_9ASCO